MPLVHGVEIAPGVRLDWSSARILGLTHFGLTTTVVAFGDAGRMDKLLFSGAAIEAAGTKDTTSRLTIAEPYSASAPVERNFRAGSQQVRILLLTREQADRTWFQGDPGQELVITGPSYLGAVDLQDGKLTAEIESAWSGKTPGIMPAAITVYGERASVSLKPTALIPDHAAVLPLTPWQTRTGSASQPEFDDSAWALAADPIELGADGNLSSYAWYRSNVIVPLTRDYLLTPSEGGDHAKVYVDGHFVTEGSFGARSFRVPLTAGSHHLALFVSHYGRQKFFANLGGFKGHDPKGLAGPVALSRGTTEELSGWRMQSVAPGGSSTTAPPPDSANWKPYKVGGPRGKRTPENAGPAWFQATLPALQPQGRRVLRFTSVDESATIYVNNQPLGSFKGRDQAFSVEIPASLSSASHVDVLVSGAGRPHNITGPVFLEQTSDEATIAGWRSHGGPEVRAIPGPWTALGGQTAAAGPVFYRSTFVLTPQAAAQNGITWRISTEGLGHGSIWLNGHNLGRYPQRIPVDGEFMPLCWMQAGSNEIVVYDEDGRAPGQVHVYAETGASRDLVSFQGQMTEP